MFKLANKVAVITGGASGIGLATARRFSSAGATVVLADVADASAVAAELGGSFFRTDVTDDDQVIALVAQTVEVHGALDVMVNNAGIIGPGQGILVDAMDDIRRVIEVNLLGTILGIKHAAQAMAPGGVIINTASMAGVIGFPGIGAYGASKSGVVGLTKHAAVELGPKGIRVNCVCPTGVHTAMIEGAQDHWAVRAQSLANQHIRRLCTADEIAAAIHYLASDEAAMVNGHALNIDGGLAAGPSVQFIEAALGETIQTNEGIVE